MWKKYFGDQNSVLLLFRPPTAEVRVVITNNNNRNLDYLLSYRMIKFDIIYIVRFKIRETGEKKYFGFLAVCVGICVCVGRWAKYILEGMRKVFTVSFHGFETVKRKHEKKVYAKKSRFPLHGSICNRSTFWP